MRSHLRAAAASGAASMGAVIAGVARVKLYALLLGAAGMGVIAQIQNLYNVLAAASMMGLGLAVARHVAGERGDAARVRRTLATARALTGGAALVLSAAVALSAVPLSRSLFGEGGQAPWIALAVSGLVFLTLARVLTEVLNGHRAYRVNALSSFWQAGLGIAILAPLLLWLGLPGAVLALPLGALAAWVVVETLLGRAHPELRGAGLRPDGARARMLLTVGAAALAGTVADESVLLVVRARLIRAHGVEANGLLQGVWGLSQQLVNVTTVFLASYPVARFHETTGGREFGREVSRTLRVTLLMMTPLAVAMVVLRGPMVTLFLAPEFRGALPLFPLQAGGVLLRAAGLALGLAVLAAAPLRAWAALGVSGALAFLAGFLALEGRLGLVAVPAAYCIAGGVLLLSAWLLLRRYGGTSLDRSAVRLLAASALLMAGVVLSADRVWAGIPAGAWLLPVWGAVVLRGSSLRELRGARRRDDP